ncbi:MAG: arylsulfatase [Armatimonadota bacterium]
MRWQRILAIPILGWFGALSFGQATAKPNIVVIYADDLGYGDVSAYGAKAVKTPNVDRLAAKGLKFTNAYATSATCTPSRFSLLTGTYAFRQKGTAVLPGNATLIVPTDKATLPSMMQRAGYKTGVVGKWHLGLGKADVEQNWNKEIMPGPREVGFDYSFIMAATGDRVPCVYLENQEVVGLVPTDPIQVSYKTSFPGEPTGISLIDRLKMKPSQGHNQSVINGIPRIGYMRGGNDALWRDEDQADTFTERGINFIKENKDHPFFLYFATHDIHVPRVPHQRFVGKTTMGARGDAIVEFDWIVGQLTATLDRLKLTDNTIIILSSDNGPVLDDGYQDKANELVGTHLPAGPLRGGKYSIFEAGTRVPFIVSWPGHVRKGTSKAIVSQIDFLSTFASFLDQPLKPDEGVDSLSLLDALFGKSNIGRTTFIEYAGTLAIREGNWKYIAPSTKSAYDASTRIELGNSKEPQLYDLAKDPGEKVNLASKNPDIVKRLSQLLTKSIESGRTRN